MNDGNISAANEKLIEEEEKRKKAIAFRELKKQTEVYYFVEDIKQKGMDLCGWEVDKDGVRRIVTKGSGNNQHSEKQIATATPIIPSGRYINRDSGIEKTQLHYYAGNKWQSRLVENRSIATKSKILDLANWGADVTDYNAALLIGYLQELRNANKYIIPDGISSSTMGWYEDDSGDEPKKSFMPYIGNSMFDGDEEFGTLYKGIESRGTVQEWTDFMLPLRKNIIFRMSMAASLASPLIELLTAQPFCFHVWGTTEIGKSVLLQAVMSIWGNPNKQSQSGLVRTFNSTQNSLMSTAAFYRHMPCCFDEMQTRADEVSFDEMIYCICEGRDRGRLTADAKVKESRSWNCTFLFAGEQPIVKNDSGGGMVNRVIEVHVTKPIFKDPYSVIKFVCKKCYGVAAKPYLEKLIEYHADGTLEDIYQGQLDYIKTAAPDVTSKQRMAMALLLTADYIASRLFWDGQEPCGIEIEDVRKFLKTATDVDVSARAYDFIMGVIAENKAKFESGTVERWGRIGNNDCVWMFQNEVTKQLKIQGYDFNAVKHAWADRGLIKTFCSGTKRRFNTQWSGATAVVFTAPREQAADFEEVKEPLPEELD